MNPSKLSVVTWTSCTNGSNLRLLELANWPKVCSDFRLAYFPQFLRCSNMSVGKKTEVDSESRISCRELLMWLVATVSISTETFKCVCSCFNLATPGQGRRLLSFSFHSGSSL